ncbi:hypothetical protein [Streptomyces macrosporus]|uniref:Uncharacterized protein n=1 Tax=Streptomyces macrosporus TaxID=44032 RepID=A0ABN3JSM6_9ACTN
MARSARDGATTDRVNALVQASIPTVHNYKDAIALRENSPALRPDTWDAVKAQMSTTTDGSVDSTSTTAEGLTVTVFRKS